MGVVNLNYIRYAKYVRMKWHVSWHHIYIYVHIYMYLWMYVYVCIYKYIYCMYFRIVWIVHHLGHTLDNSAIYKEHFEIILHLPSLQSLIAIIDSINEHFKSTSSVVFILCTDSFKFYLVILNSDKLSEFPCIACIHTRSLWCFSHLDFHISFIS